MPPHHPPHGHRGPKHHRDGPDGHHKLDGPPKKGPVGPHHGPHHRGPPHHRHHNHAEHHDTGDLSAMEDILTVEVGAEAAGWLTRYAEDGMPPHIRAKIEQGVADIACLRAAHGAPTEEPAFPDLGGDGVAFLWDEDAHLPASMVAFLEDHCGERATKLADWHRRGPEHERLLSVIVLLRSRLISDLTADGGEGGPS